MPRAAKIDPFKFPQSEDSWVLAIRKLRSWIADDSEEPIRAFVMILVNRSEGLILASEIVKEASSRDIQNSVSLYHA